jgi:hypothetical protein
LCWTCNWFLYLLRQNVKMKNYYYHFLMENALLKALNCIIGISWLSYDELPYFLALKNMISRQITHNDSSCLYRISWIINYILIWTI